LTLARQEQQQQAEDKDGVDLPAQDQRRADLRRKTRKHTHPTPRMCAGVRWVTEMQDPHRVATKTSKPAINHVFGRFSDLNAVLQG